MRWGYIINNSNGNKLSTAITAIIHYTVLIINQILLKLVLLLPGAKQKSLVAMENARLVTKVNIPYEDVKYKTEFGMEFMVSADKFHELALVFWREIWKTANIGGAAPNSAVIDVSTGQHANMLDYQHGDRPLVVTFGSCT